ncbi:hypothetical protein Tco_0802032 [Tanacetum coccineum]|uniref:Uncharacterized protein n=1 Tax=Tanacetum coccineum TaxID=301880 RepID=A0ABQ4ZXP0_9ASTR
MSILLLRPCMCASAALLECNMEYLVIFSKRRAFWSLNEDILKIIDSDYQYAVSIKEDTAYPCLHSPKTTKERRSIRRFGCAKSYSRYLNHKSRFSEEKKSRRGLATHSNP